MCKYVVIFMYVYTYAYTIVCLYECMHAYMQRYVHMPACGQIHGPLGFWIYWCRSETLYGIMHEAQCVSFSAF